MENGIKLFLVMTGLFIFGTGYNELVAWLEKNKHDRGYTAFLVVGGVVATLMGLWVLEGAGVFLSGLALFAASGLPMVIGSMYRSSKARQDDEEKAKQVAMELLDDQKTNGRLRIPAGDPAGNERQ